MSGVPYIETCLGWIPETPGGSSFREPINDNDNYHEDGGYDAEDGRVR